MYSNLMCKFWAFLWGKIMFENHTVLLHSPAMVRFSSLLRWGWASRPPPLSWGEDGKSPFSHASLLALESLACFAIVQVAHLPWLFCFSFFSHCHCCCLSSIWLAIKFFLWCRAWALLVSILQYGRQIYRPVGCCFQMTGALARAGPRVFEALGNYETL